MALPGDVDTFTLRIGHTVNGYTDPTGAVSLVGAKGWLFTVDPTTNRRVNVTHVATGQTLVPSNVDILLNEDGKAKATVSPLPYTDDEKLAYWDGSAFRTGFAYRIEWDIPSGSRSFSPRNKTFQVPTAAGATVDFDLLDVAAAVPGVLVPMGVSAGVADAAVSALLPGPSLTQAAFDGRYATDAELAAGLATKVNSSTYTAGLAGKQDVATLGADVAANATVRAAFGAPADWLAMARVERHAALRASASQVQALGRAQRATEWTETWTDLSSWNDTGVQVSGGKLYGISGGTPSAAVRSISIPAGGRFRATTVLHYTGTVKSLYFGISNGAADSAPVSPDTNSVLLGIIGSGGQAGKIGTFVGSNVTGLASALGASPSPVAAGDYQFTVAADETFLSLSARRVGSQNDDWLVRCPRSGLPGGGAVINLILSNSDNAGLTGSSWDKVYFANELTSPNTTGLISDPWTVGTRSSGGVNWRLQVPAGYLARKPAPLVVFMHQSLTGLASNPYTETRMANVTAAFAAAGYLLASSDNGTSASAGGDNDKYGNQAGLDDYEALIRWCQDHFAVGPILLLGSSMGGQFVENMLAQRRVGGIAAAASIGPGLDLLAAAANPTYTAPILAAYGAADTTDLATKVVGYNPIAHSAIALRGVPQRFYVSSDDPTAPPATHVTPLVTKLTGIAAEASVVTVTGGHLPAASYQGSDLVSFFGAYV